MGRFPASRPENVSGAEETAAVLSDGKAHLLTGRTVHYLSEGVAIKAAAPFIALLLSLAAAPGWPQEIVRAELDTAAGRIIAFESFKGPDPVVESVPQIRGIGGALARSLRAGGGRGSYFSKYHVVRVYDPVQTSLLGADIIILDPDAHVNDIANLRRIVAGYLETAFGYSAAQADRLAVLVTNYNAAYRGNIAALALKYTGQVMSNLTAENAGLALSYKDWPGKTRLVIPLGRGGGQSASGQNAGGRPGAAAPGAAAAPGSASPGPAPGTAAQGAAPAPGPALARSRPGTGSAPGSAPPRGPSSAGPGPSMAEPGPSTTVPAQTGASASAEPPSAVSPAPAPAGPGASELSERPAPAQGSPPGRAFPFGSPVWMILILALLAAAVLVLVLLVIRILRQGLRPTLAGDLYLSAREGHPLVEMIVTTQNRHIGFRNVHYLRPGSSAAVGGGRSTFLVYFVPVPGRIAYLQYDGQKYTFVPVKSALFPDLPGPVPDCLGVEIPSRSPRGYKFTIVFHKFIPPLDEINRLMRSIQRVR